MADQADVETALAAFVANALYPNGTSSDSVIGRICRVYRGWPTAPALDADLKQSVLNISVGAADAPARNVTRYERRWIATAPVASSLNASVAGNSVSFSGSCAVGQLAGIMADTSLFSYAVQQNDKPATVASNLAAMVRSGGWIVDYSGCAFTVPKAARFGGRVVNGSGALQEIKRQAQEFRISMWCPDPATRDVVAPVIDLALAGLTFIPLADGSYGRVLYSGTLTEDGSADASLYRRDLIYQVEYPTTLAQVSPAMLFGLADVSANGALTKVLQV